MIGNCDISAPADDGRIDCDDDPIPMVDCLDIKVAVVLFVEVEEEEEAIERDEAALFRADLDRELDDEAGCFELEKEEKAVEEEDDEDEEEAEETLRASGGEEFCRPFTIIPLAESL